MQVARLDTCYRTLAAASAEPREDDQNAVLRDRICNYFEETSNTGGASSEGDGEGMRAAQDAAATADGDAAATSQLAGLPLREPPPALALDVRELLAFARRSGGSGRGGGKKGAAPEVCAVLWELVGVSACSVCTRWFPCIACPE